METEIKAAVGAGTFDALREAVAKELGCGQLKDVQKTQMVPLVSSRSYYRRGERVPILERIVERITALAAPRIADAR